MDEKPDYCYVGFLPCGHAKAIGVCDCTKGTASFVADMIKGGLYIERHPWEHAHDLFQAGRSCECKPITPPERQAKLFDV